MEKRVPLGRSPGPRPRLHAAAGTACPRHGPLLTALSPRPVLQKAPLLLHYRPKMDLL